MPVTNEAAEQGPYEVLLELLRARDAGRPHPSREFLFEEQEYIRRWEAGKVKTERFGWGAEVLAGLEAIQGEPMDWPAAERLGDQLTDLLAGLKFREDEHHIEEALRDGRTVHLTLRAAAAELHALPWELVRMDGQALGAQPQLLLRYEWPGSAAATPVLDPPAEGGRILFVYSSAGGDVRADRHLEAIRQACREGHHPFDEERDVVAEVSLAKLKEALTEAPVAVLHILCHGGMVPSSLTSYGLLWREGDRTTAIDARTLARCLADQRGSLRLVVLSACHGGGQGDVTSRLGSVAQELHRLGIPAVVASRYPLSIRGSIDLTEVLYHELLVERCSLEDAVIAARRHLHHERPLKADWASLQLYARAADGPDHRPFVLRPYRGLEAFREQDRRFFFGRTDEVHALVDGLERLVQDERPRFLVVAGASGTGKSSMVFAGAVPELCARGWTVLRSFRPGSSPCAELAGARQTLEEELQERRTRTDRSVARFLILVDQLEEIFTHLGHETRHREERDAFVRGLWELARREDACVGVIVTMRVDFIGHSGEIVLDPESDYRFDRDLVYREEHRLLVPQMDRAQLREVIEGPARRVGLLLDKGLCEQILNDIGKEPGALPLLEFALDLLWRRRKGNVLSAGVYNAPDFGGTTGALAGRADEVLAGLDTDAQREAARRLFQRLVSVRNDAQDARRRVPLKDLHLEQQPDVKTVLDRFLQARLLVRDDPTVLVRNDPTAAQEKSAQEGGGASRSEPTVEVAHEALIQHWDTLRRWVNEARKQLVDFDTLRDWVKEKRETAKVGKDFLLGGGQLERAVAIREDHGSVLDEEATKDPLLQEALDLIEESEAVRLAEAEAKRRAEEETKEQRHRARQFALLAGARELAVHGQPHWAARLLSYMEPGQTRGWDELAWTLLSWRGILRAVLRGHEGEVHSAMFSPDDRHILTTSADGTVRVWAADGTGNPKVFQGDADKVHSAEFSPDGKRIVASSLDGTARVWNANGLGAPVVLQGHQDRVLSAVFSPDGEHIPTMSADGTVWAWNGDGTGKPVAQVQGGSLLFAVFSLDRRRVLTVSRDMSAWLWDTRGEEYPVELRGHHAFVKSAMFSPDGRRIVITSADGTVRVWDIPDSRNPWDRPRTATPRVLRGHKRTVNCAVFSPENHRIVTASADGTARVWNVDGVGEPLVLRGHRGEVKSAAFSPDGQRIVTASADGTARVWSLSGQGEPLILQGHRGEVKSAAFSHDGQYVVTTSRDGTARVWNVNEMGEPLVLQGHPGCVWSAAFSPDGQRIVTTSFDGVARVWSADGQGEPVIIGRCTGRLAVFSPDGEQVLTAFDRTARLWSGGGGSISVLRGHKGKISSVAFSPDGQRIVTASEDHTARVWNADGRGEPVILRGHEGQVSSAAFSPDGQRIVTASEDHTARVWNTGGTGDPVVLRGHTDCVCFAVFSPDGRCIATASWDRTARVWGADGKSEPVVLQGHEDKVTAAVLSPDGQRVVTVSEDSTARVWNADGKGEPLVLRGRKGAVRSAVFSRDGRRIVTASRDDTPLVWNVDGKGEPLVLQGHRGAVISAGFSADGRRIVTASEDGTVRVWSADREQLGKALHRLTTASLPVKLRRDYLDESEEEARQRYEEEERRYGRWPPMIADVVEDAVGGVRDEATDARVPGDGAPDFGDVTGVLARKADEVLGQLDTDAEREAARQLFQRLVLVRHHAQDSRRRVPLKDLLREQRPEMKAVLDRFLKANLLVLDDGEGFREAVDYRLGLDHERRDESREQSGQVAPEPIVEVVNEAFIWRWRTLRGWVNDARQQLADFERLREWAKDQRDSLKRWKPHVLGGSQLEQALRIRDEHGAALQTAAMKDPLLQEALKLIDKSEVEAAAARQAEAARWAEAEAARRAEAEAARRARQLALLAGAREFIARNEPHWAAKLLLHMEPTQIRGWDNLAWKVASWQGSLSAVLQGHRGKVTSAVFSPDGQRIVTASADGTARVWNANGTGKPVVLAGHEKELSSATFSFGGRRIVTASVDGTVRAWNADGQGEPVVLKGHEKDVWSAVFSPDDQHIVTASRDGTARVWNADGQGEPVVLKGHEKEVWSAVFSPDGQRIVTASADGTARVWSADGQGEPVVLKHMESVLSAAFSPDGQRIVTASADGTAHVWNALDDEWLLLLEGHEDSVLSALFSPDGQRIVTASADGTARVWNTDGEDELVRQGAYKHVINVAKFSPDGQRIVTSSADGAAHVWSISREGEPALRGSYVHVVTSSTKDTVKVWSVNSQAEPVVLGRHEEVWVAVFSPDGQRIVTASRDGTARVWNADGQGEPVVLKGHQERVWSAVFSPDGQRIVTASRDGTARVWNANGLGAPVVLKGHQKMVLSAVFSPDGQRIVTSSWDWTARVWNADGQGEPVVLKGHQGRVWSAVFSPDGQRIVTSSWDWTARVWNANGLKAPVVLKGHQERVLSAVFSPDGQHIVTSSADGTARVWDADRTSEPVLVLGHASKVYSAAFSPDGRRIITSSADGTVRVWDADRAGEPVLVLGHVNKVYSGSFSPDGQRIVASHTHVNLWVRGLANSQQRLLGRLRRLTTLSLPPWVRRDYLGESEEEAQQRYEEEERLYGRLPIATAAEDVPRGAGDATAARPHE